MSSFEKNAAVLASLEDEWGHVGPLRLIEFNLRFNEFDYDETPLDADRSVAEFVTFAKGECCTCDVFKHDGGSDRRVVATKIMRPLATEITALQERLAGFAGNLPGGSFLGWNYPRKKEISFWPDCTLSNKQAADARASVLFGPYLVADPIKPTGFDPRASGQNGASRFQLVPSEFLRHADANPPNAAQPTASGFAQWVYSLYGSQGRDEDREAGKAAEEEIWNRRCASVSSNDNGFLRSIGSPWSLIHNGLHLDRDRRPDYFDVPNLRVKGEALKVSPDLVYANRKSEESCIVEVKYSHLPIPRNLWPNVWAQLWCYSHIEQAVSARKVTVVGEVWSETWSRSYGQGRQRVQGQRLVSLRTSVRRDPRAPAYDRFFRALFDIYSR
jgi:hypothetical protein